MLGRLLIAAMVTAIGAGAGWSATLYQYEMETRSSTPQYYYQRVPPGQPIPPGAVETAPGEWWIVQQPYYPYTGYNPPVSQGYYPPYPSGGYYDQYGRYFPAPPLVTPPTYIPPLQARPVSPPPLRIRRLPGGGYLYERDPHFYLYAVPQGPDYLTNGMTAYVPPPYPYYYPYPPYPVYPSDRDDHHRH